jgi:hypothetical protein
MKKLVYHPHSSCNKLVRESLENNYRKPASQASLAFPEVTVGLSCDVG